MSAPRSLPQPSPRARLDADAQRSILRHLPLAHRFSAALERAGVAPLCARGIEVLQLNLGKLCNQTCRHCHVDAGPARTEVMTRDTMQQCLSVLDASGAATVDLTGGAPELNPEFRWLLERLAERRVHVIDRCNLTVLETGAHRDLPELFAQHRVEVVCSLPHYRSYATDRQRGEGVFEKSIRALRRLNALGYGDGRSGLRLALVTNPVGAFLPASQEQLEREWKGKLLADHGVVFDSLYTITNMPISRYLEWLLESENLQGYMDELVAAFNPAAARGVMCRSTLSVGWDGQLYDCDFNQMLELPLRGGLPRHVRDFDAQALAQREIGVDDHCFGCTAGAGSSCGGALA